MDDLNEVVRLVLRRIMEDRGLSQNKFAELLGVPQRSLGRMLNGESGTSLARLAEFCHALQMTPAEFFQRFPGYSQASQPHDPNCDCPMHERLRELYTVSEHELAIERLVQLRELGIYETAEKLTRGLIEAARVAQQGAFREASRQAKTQRKKKARR